MRKKTTAYAAAVLAVLLLCALPAAATGSARILEIKPDGNQLMSLVRGGAGGEVTASLGKTPVTASPAQPLRESGMELHTLILVDNSLSIPETSRGVIQTQLLELAAARQDNEYFALGSVSDHVSVRLDFTKDYTRLKNAIESLEYQYQDTFLTDALYDYLVSEPFEGAAGCFERILLVSDGVDNKSLGYTKGELLTLLKDAPIPIYAIGVQTGVEGNNEEIENMFALARAANGETMLLGELDSGASDLCAVMDRDWDCQVVRVEIPEEIQDGSLQTLTLRFGGEGSTASLDNIRMPLLEEQLPTPTPPPTSTPTPTAPPVPTPSPTPEPEEDGLGKYLPVILICAAIVIAAAVLAVALAIHARGKKEPGAPPPDTQSPAPDAPPSKDGPSTVIVHPSPSPDPQPGGRPTVRVMGQRPVCSISLTDLHNPNKFFQKTFERSLVVGSNTGSDICVSYDATVSRKQCELILENRDLYIVNHSQSNITLLNGRSVNQKMLMHNGDIITMGLVEMRVSFQV